MLPMGLAIDFGGQPLGPMFFSVADVQEPNPAGCSLATAGRKKLTCEIGGIPPLGFCAVAPYPDPSISYSASTAAPAPRMFPVPGQLPPPGFGTGIALAVNL